MPLFGHPSGMPEGSRGLRSALRDDTPGACAATPASRRDARFSAQNTGSGTPPGCDFLPCLNRGASLRSTPGYLLASLQDVSGRLLRLSSIPLETARNFTSPVRAAPHATMPLLTEEDLGHAFLQRCRAYGAGRLSQRDKIIQPGVADELATPGTLHALRLVLWTQPRSAEWDQPCKGAVFKTW